MPRRISGFTLIELMIAVVVIGVLAAVASPFYSTYRNRIRTEQAVEQIAAISTAASSYFLDNRVFPNSLADMGYTNAIDPWGNPYVYYNIAANGKGGARKDHALNPLNTDFDVYSMGADGLSKPQITQKESLDDVIRASNGAYLGLASNF